MITIYDKAAQDFSTLGLGTLEPTICKIEEQAGGLYELTLRQPITDDGRAFLLEVDRIIKAEAPVRETPQLTIDNAASVARATITREVWQVNTSEGRLHLREKPNGRILNAYPAGTRVVKYGESDTAGWWGVIVCDGGAKGYMYSQYLTYVGTETEEVQGDTPGTIIQPKQARDQFFRIYSVIRDSHGRFIEARARHISYDLASASVAGKLDFKNKPVAQVINALKQLADHETGINIICGVSGKVSADYSGKNLLECLLEPDIGIVSQTGAKVVRDNFDIYLVPDEERDRGIEIRYGKNLQTAQLETDASNVITRIIPVGRDKDGEPLYGEAVDSSHIDEYATIRAAVVEYDVTEGDDLTRSEALKLLKQKAQEDFEAGADAPDQRLDATFVRLELAEQYAHLANAYALHLYDSVPVIDRGAGIDIKVRMTGYTFDAIRKRYTETKLSDTIEETGGAVYGYDIAGGSINGIKLANATISGGKLRDGAVSYAKMDQAAITHLTSDSVIAIRADIHKVVAGEMTTDELYADLAKITNAAIEHAEISGASIKDATIETAKIALGAITTALIADGSITSAKIVSLNADVINAGTLAVDRLLLKGENGLFQAINATDSGLTTEQLTQEEYQNAISGSVLVADSVTADKINVTSLFAAEATIEAINNVLLRTETIEALNGVISVRAVRDGSQLVLTKDEIRMETPIFSVNVTGDRGDMTLDEDGLSAEYINSPSVRPMYYGPAELTVQTDSADGISSFTTLSDAFYRLNGRYMAYPVTIYVRSAQPEASAELSYTDGAPITICKAAGASTPAINAHLELLAVRNLLTLEDLNVGYTSGDNCVTARNCMCVIARNCNFVTSTATLSTAHAFFVERSQAEFYNCGFFNGYGGVFGERLAHIYMEGCKGAGLRYGVAVRYGSRASATTSIPPGSTNASYATSDSEYRGTTSTASATSPFAPATTNTVELTLTNTRTYAGGWYGSGTTMIAQGVSGGTSFRGYMWFDFSPISGRTIKQAALKLYRKAGIGKSAYADIYIGAAKVAGPGSAVEASKEYGKVGAAAQNSKTQISVPVEAMQAIADGTYNALYVYSPQSEDYAAFEGIGETNPPRLAVLY